MAHPPPSTGPHATTTPLALMAPGAFVLIWSTGFLVGRGVAPHADPFWFLSARFACVALAFSAAALWVRAAWPSGGRRIALHLLAGALMSGIYLGPSWWAMARGMPAGVMALIGALQPLFTALVAVLWLRQHLPARTWGGLALGFGGVALVLAPRLAATDAGALPWPVVLAAAGSIVSLTLGAMVQKSRWLAQDDLRSASLARQQCAVNRQARAPGRAGAVDHIAHRLADIFDLVSREVDLVETLRLGIQGQARHYMPARCQP